MLPIIILLFTNLCFTSINKPSQIVEPSIFFMTDTSKSLSTYVMRPPCELAVGFTKKQSYPSRDTNGNCDSSVIQVSCIHIIGKRICCEANSSSVAWRLLNFANRLCAFRLSTLHAPYRMGTGKDEFHSDTTEEGFIAIQCNNRFWGGVWSDMTIEQILARTKNGFWWAYMRVQKCREHLMGGCQFAYHCVPQLRSPMAARLILLRSIVRHITTKAWNQPNRQIWGIKHIRCFMDIIMAISFHCLLVSLMTPQLFVTMQRKYASSFNSRWLEKAYLLPKMKGVRVMTLEGMTSSIAVRGQDGTVSPSRSEWYASCKARAQLILMYSFLSSLLALYR